VVGIPNTEKGDNKNVGIGIVGDMGIAWNLCLPRKFPVFIGI